MDKKVVWGNLIVAMLAQGISLVLSFLISFIVPKMLDVEAFSYWQLFIFYTTYVGFFHFGLNDGVYLKYGGIDLDKMNKNLVSGQFKCLCMIQIAVVIIMLPIIACLNVGRERSIVCFFALAYMVIFNLSNYLAYIFQAANLTKWYSYSVILDKVFFMLAVLCLLVIKNTKFQFYIIFYVVGKLICLFFCIFKGYKFIFYRCTDYHTIANEFKNSVCVGIKLTVSSMASMLILGIGRFIIDSHWGISIFGKISFALSLTTFILAFIQQISMVFFPILRRVDEGEQNRIYQLMREFCFFIMPLIYIVMIPGKMCIEAWLPQYTESVYYLGILLPICVFDSKMNMIFNTFFKVLRMEKDLLRVNIISFVLSCSLSLIGVYIFDSYVFVIVSMVASVMFRSIISENRINKVFCNSSKTQLRYEFIYAVLYIVVSALRIEPIYALLILGGFYLIELFLFRNEFFGFICKLKKAID